MKLLITILILIISINTFACDQKVIKAIKSVEAVNYDKDINSLELVEHKLLGEVMIATGTLLKFQTVIENDQENFNSYYQSYVYPKDCIVKEINKFKPWTSRSRY